MPRLIYQDWSVEYTRCKWYCQKAWQETLYCWVSCRNVEKFDKETQTRISRLEKQLYNTSIVKQRWNILLKINQILDENNNKENSKNWNTLNQIERELY